MSCTGERIRGWAAAWAAVLLLAGCGGAGGEAPVVEPRFLELGPPLDDREAEISGLSWYEEDLLIVPQFPDRFGTEGELVFFYLPRADLESALASTRPAPLEPRPIVCHAPWLVPIIRGYDGLESGCSVDGRCYMTVEAERDTSMAGFVVSGRFTVEAGADTFSIELERVTSIPLIVNLPNMSQETIIQDGRRVIAINEANGAAVIAGPVAHVFGLDLEDLGTIPFPRVEYRVTDATDLDEAGRFWVLNYFWPADRGTLRPADDPEVERHGAPPWLGPDTCVERLLELQLLEDRIVRTDRPPVWIRPREDGECRNWEAVARMGDRGFLLVTDKYPATLMAYVPLPAAAGGP